jgi:hypothetical protein
VFVSDVLESVVDMREIRALVRARCQKLTADLPPAIAGPISDSAVFFGGKCMGYPAVWFVHRALDLDVRQTSHLLDGAWTSLCISLSTSITDDLMDGDTDVSGEALMFLYVLLFKALEQADWNQDGLGHYIYQRSVELMPLFVHHDRARLANPPRRGDRIGHFHRMIAYDMLRRVDLGPDRRDALVELAGKFGHLCADLDDVLDLEIDVLNGEMDNFAASIALARGPVQHGGGNLAELLAVVSTVEVETTIGQHMARAVDELCSGCESMGASSLAGTLAEIGGRIPAAVRRLRAAAHAEFVERQSLAIAG